MVLDEIHKYRRWKNYLKGVYDEFHESYQFLVIGSGRLDVYQRGGDSLAGRLIREDVGPAYNTIKSWLGVLERFYLLFSIPTWTPRIVRAIRKEKKAYLLNYAVVDDPAARFEKLVNEGEEFRLSTRGRRKILVAPAWQWLSRLP